MAVGAVDGEEVGTYVCPSIVGVRLGAFDGCAVVGTCEGVIVGADVGVTVVGLAVGAAVGSFVGDAVGETVHWPQSGDEHPKPGLHAQ
jgi:hypothetical protein